MLFHVSSQHEKRLELSAETVALSKPRCNFKSSARISSVKCDPPWSCFAHQFKNMAPKRKTETVPEPSPPTKRRSTKVKAPTEKKRARESDEQDAATRARRSKKKTSEDEESVAEPVVVITPRKRVSKVVKAPESPVVVNTRSPAPPKSAMKSAAKPRSRYAD